MKGSNEVKGIGLTLIYFQAKLSDGVTRRSSVGLRFQSRLAFILSYLA